MSTSLMAHVWMYSPCKGDALLVMLALADWSHDDGVSAPSISDLSQKARMPQRQTIRVLSKLRKEGHIEVENNQGPNGAHLYKIVMPPDPADTTFGEGRLTALGREMLSSRAPESTGSSAFPEKTTAVVRNQLNTAKSKSKSPSGFLSKTVGVHAHLVDYDDGPGGVVALYIDTLAERGVKQYPKSLPSRVGKEVKQLLEGGMDMDLVQVAAKVAAQRNLAPTAIPYLAMEAQAPARRNGNGRYGRGVTTEMIKEARRLLREQG